MDYFFHGSYIRNLKLLQPFSKSHNTIKKPVVYLTKSYLYALFYIWNRPFKWVTFDIDENGIVNFTEQFENQLYEFYHGISGCIYKCDINNPFIYLTHMNNVYNSEKPVPITGCSMVDDVYFEILKGEKDGLIRVKRFDKLKNDELEEISKTTIRAIHMQKLLLSNSEMADFVKEKFPDEWECASKNTEQEIKEMIDEWKRSLNI